MKFTYYHPLIHILVPVSFNRGRTASPTYNIGFFQQMKLWTVSVGIAIRKNIVFAPITKHNLRFSLPSLMRQHKRRRMRCCVLYKRWIYVPVFSCLSVVGGFATKGPILTRLCWQNLYAICIGLLAAVASVTLPESTAHLWLGLNCNGSRMPTPLSKIAQGPGGKRVEQDEGWVERGGNGGWEEGKLGLRRVWVRWQCLLPNPNPFPGPSPSSLVNANIGQCIQCILWRKKIY